MVYRLIGLSFAGLILLISGCVNNDAGKADTLLVAERFNLSDISLLDGPFRQAQELDRSVPSGTGS